MAITEQEYQEYLRRQASWKTAPAKNVIQPAAEDEISAAVTVQEREELTKKRPVILKNISKVKDIPKSWLPNKTERRFMRDILDPEYFAGRILFYRFQLITLKYTTGKRAVRYTPDFTVFMPDGRIVLHEIKGPWIEDDARVKFLSVREILDKYFDFHCWQYIDRKWGEIWSK